MSDPVIRGIFDALVKRAGGVEVVAALLEARYGVGWKGTVSKMCSGKAGINIDAIIAVEDFVGDFPLTGVDSGSVQNRALSPDRGAVVAVSLRFH